MPSTYYYDNDASVVLVRATSNLREVLREVRVAIRGGTQRICRRWPHIAPTSGEHPLTAGYNRLGTQGVALTNAECVGEIRCARCDQQPV